MIKVTLGRWYFAMGSDEYPYIIRADRRGPDPDEYGPPEGGDFVFGPQQVLYGGYALKQFRFGDLREEGMSPVDEELYTIISWSTQEEAQKGAIYLVKCWQAFGSTASYEYLHRANYFGFINAPVEEA